MKRITIFGNSGSGKTTLALKLKNILRIPVVHLDLYCLCANKLSLYDFEQIHKNFCNQSQWIIEGLETNLLESRVQNSDTIIFLDLPKFICLFRLIKRILSNLTKDNTKACPDIINLKILKKILNFDKNEKIKIQDLIEKYKNQKNFIILKNQQDVNEFLKNLK